MDERPIPLCVDLDGTLVRTDLLHEAALALVKQEPFALIRLPGWLFSGKKAALKHAIAERIRMDVAHLPYREEVLALIREARAEGRPVVLATAAAPQIAEAVAEHLGLFDRVVSSDGATNLSSEAKAARLVEEYGEGGFDYVGNDARDLAVWKRSRHAILVSRSNGLHARASAGGREVRRIDDPARSLKPWIKSLRPHQWLKNLLVFVPLFAAQKSGDLALLVAAALAFISFSAAASSVYIVNDLLDLPADRRHRRKRNRPFASGALPVAAGVVMAALLFAGSLAVALALLPLPFLLVLGFYLFLTTAYSVRLKQQVVLDVILLAGLYTLRIVAGAAATTIVPSFWLLAFSMFLFLSLAIVKRYSELRQEVDERKLIAGRGYMASDLPVLMGLGASSGMAAVMVLALYIDSPIVASAYRESLWLWLVPPAMLYWVARLWMKAHRGEVHDDPVVFAARDRQSLAMLLFLGIVFLAAVQGWRFW